jgi:hypothetical protein
MRTTIISAVVAIAVPLAPGVGAMSASAAPDNPTWKFPRTSATLDAPVVDISASGQMADAVATWPKQRAMTAKDVILYNIISDQISEMRRKSALPAVMCIAESTSDGGAGTISGALMAQLEADNAQVRDSLFTLKQATECRNAGRRLVDRETHERAMMIVAGPMEAEMKGLMSGCGDYVGGFVRAAGDSDFDFYTINGGDVARKLGCELAQ